MENKKNYYEILGISIDATEDEIKTAYRKLSKKFHPDVSKEENAEEKFKEVVEAYSVLSKPEKRAEYDQELRYSFGSSTFSGFKGRDFNEDAFMDMFFGKKRQQGFNDTMNINLKYDEVVVKPSRPMDNPIEMTYEDGKPVGIIRFGEHVIKIFTEGEISIMDRVGNKTKVKKK